MLRSFFCISVITLLLAGCAFQQGARPQKYFSFERSWARHTLHDEYLLYRLNHAAEPVLYEKLVIQANEIDGIRAYNKKSGRSVWSRAISGGVASGVRLHGDTLYFGGGDGFYHALSAKSGQSKWSFPVRSDGLGAPLVHDGVVYFLSGAGVVYALKAENGEQLWLYSRPDTAALTIRGAAEPSVYGNNIIVGFSDGSLVALSQDKGAVVWENLLGEGPRFKDVDSKPVVDEDRIYASSYDGRLYAVRAASGQVIWSHDEGAFTPVTIEGDRIYYATSTRKVVALDRKSGKMIWTRELENTVASQPVIFRGLVIFSEWAGGLRAVDARTGKDVTRFVTGRGVTSRPTIDEDRDMVYVMTTDANLFAVRLALRHPNEVWPWEK